MRKHLAAALAASLLLTGSVATFAAQATKAATHATAEKTAKGAVKSIDAGKLVLKTTKGDMTFSLGSTKADNITAGSMVQVHYKADGKGRVATSVMLDSKTTAKK
jgi:hypothetical protein